MLFLTFSEKWKASIHLTTNAMFYQKKKRNHRVQINESSKLRQTKVERLFHKCLCIFPNFLCHFKFALKSCNFAILSELNHALHRFSWEIWSSILNFSGNFPISKSSITVAQLSYLSENFNFLYNF